MAVTSRLRLWRSASDHLTFDCATAAVRYAPQGERLTDRLGYVHRIAPATARAPVGLGLTLLPEELTRLNCPGASPRLDAVSWLERAFRQQEPLTVFLLGLTVSESNSGIARCLAYQGYLDELPGEGFGTLPQVGAAVEQVELLLTVVADGTFADFDVLDSAVYAPRG